MSFEIKQHDTARVITHTLKLNDVALNLTGCTVTVMFRDGSGVAFINATIVNAAQGDISWQMPQPQAAQVGVFEIEFKVVYPDSSRITLPTASRLSLTIHAALA